MVAHEFLALLVEVRVLAGKLFFEVVVAGINISIYIICIGGLV
jgi:hypothetical protein